jgi:hypothetical protein
MKKAGFVLVVIIFSYLLLETGLRTVLCLSTTASFLRPSEIIYNYYPELLPIQRVDISNTDSTLDILILSCSVLHKDWVDIVGEMNKCTRIPAGYNRVKIYNASGVGHGSRDNLIKYGLLKDKKFDVVVYYDAINDSRLNNCPDSIFKSDYSHYLWYDEINAIVAHPEMNFTVVPFFYSWMKIRLKLLAKNIYIPKHFSLKPEWLAYGSKMKSLPCYERNVKRVMDMAQQQRAQFLYLTFAYYLPSDYSLQKFQNKTLDYSFCDHSRETEIWGTPQNVSRFIDSINVDSKAWVSPYKNARWADLYTQFPKTGEYFADICHFSPKGIHQFAAMACSALDSMVNMDKSH